MKGMKRALAIVLAVAVALLIATPVFAAPPIVETGGETIDYPMTYQPCPDLTVWDHETYTYVSRYTVDEAGVLLHFELHSSGVDNFYNPANPGVVLSGHFAGNVHYDANTGEYYTTSAPFHITVPGYGTVLVRAGRWTGWEGEHIAGKDSFNSPQDMQQFCACLRGH
jgi:hypothetical protein